VAPQKNSKKHFIIFLVGSTGVGKTALSFYLADKLSASILNCDSISMYRGLDIGSAKPLFHKTQASYFLFNEWDPPFTCTAGLFRKKALSILEKELPRHSVLAVGGSGFYIQALEKGMYSVGGIKPTVKELVTDIQNKKGSEHLYKLLQFLDPQYAKKISAKDSYRVFRSLCIILSEEKLLSHIQTVFQAKTLPYPYFKLGLYLSRLDLLKRVQKRTEDMIKKGLLEETQDLMDRGLEKWSILKSVGYRESVLFLQNKISMEDLKNRIVYRTM